SDVPSKVAESGATPTSSRTHRHQSLRTATTTGATRSWFRVLRKAHFFAPGTPSKTPRPRCCRTDSERGADRSSARQTAPPSPALTTTAGTAPICDGVATDSSKPSLLSSKRLEAAVDGQHGARHVAGLVGPVQHHRCG